MDPNKFSSAFPASGVLRLKKLPSKRCATMRLPLATRHNLLPSVSFIERKTNKFKLRKNENSEK